jgi:hypothetical protein
MSISSSSSPFAAGGTRSRRRKKVVDAVQDPRARTEHGKRVPQGHGLRDQLAEEDVHVGERDDDEGHGDRLGQGPADPNLRFDRRDDRLDGSGTADGGGECAHQREADLDDRQGPLGPGLKVSELLTSHTPRSVSSARSRRETVTKAIS